MKITKQFLIENGACYEGKDAFKKVYGEEADLAAIAKLATKTGGNYLNFALWLIVRCLTHVQKVKYVVFAAEKVIAIFEEKYPDDKRPREAIEAAKAWIGNPRAHAARAAAYAARAAADAADYAPYAADAAARAAAHAARAAAHAADAAAYAAYAVAYAAYAAGDVAARARDDIKKQCLAFGLEIIEETETK